jgi:hypothetical protein
MMGAPSKQSKSSDKYEVFLKNLTTFGLVLATLQDNFATLDKNLVTSQDNLATLIFLVIYLLFQALKPLTQKRLTPKN